MNFLKIEDGLEHCLEGRRGIGSGVKAAVGLGGGFLLQPSHLTLVQQSKDQAHGFTRRQD